MATESIKYINCGGENYPIDAEYFNGKTHEEFSTELMNNVGNLYSSKEEVSILDNSVTDVRSNLTYLQNSISSKAEQDDIDILEGNIAAIQTRTSSVESDINALTNQKQNVLTPGTGIRLDDNGTISSTVTQYDDSALRSLINSNQSLLNNVEDRVSANETSINTLTGNGVGSISNKINSSLNGLSGSATIASNNSGIVTLKGNIVESYGIINNGGNADIILSKIATTGNAGDLSCTYNSSSSNVQNVINTLNGRISILENHQHISNVICDADAGSIPSGITYRDGSTTITGTMSPESAIEGAIYMVRQNVGGETAFDQYIVANTGGTLSWQYLGSTKTNLTGYIKNVSVNRGTYTGNSEGTIILPDYIDEIEVGGNKSWNESMITIRLGSTSYNSGSRSIELIPQIKTTDNMISTSSTNDAIPTSETIKSYVNDYCLAEFRTYID